ncbi:Adenylate-forming reductase [Paramyrothecium foliicola]|nr:Adenylate-forming reductase [Paramyrothecium foliicola]
MAEGFRRDFIRPKFTPLPGNNTDTPDEITSLPDLIKFNAENNPDHIFCIQSQVSRGAGASSGQEPTYNGVSITFGQLQQAVRKSANWLSKTISLESETKDSTPSSPVALYQESDVGLFIHLVALQSLDVPVLLISARLSAPNVEHLLRETGSQTVLASKRTAALLEGQIDSVFNLKTVEPYTTFLLEDPQSEQYAVKPVDGTNINREARLQKSAEDSTRKTLILHSSGTTGFPKPILLTKRYLLGYAACHQFSEREKIDWVNLSTLPLYHGFGFLAPGLSLSLGMTCCFPPSSVIPAGQSTFDLLKTFNCRSLMTVPSIIDDLFAIDGALERLSTLVFLAVGGGALKPDQGLRLKAGNVNLLNHYGVTEIGAIAPIFRPGDDYNWRFLRLRSDLNLELRPVEGSPRFKLVGYPMGWNTQFEVQDELERNPEAKPQHIEIRILGRTDDVIVLKTGEKIMPQHLETALGADPLIKTAVCIGQGSFEPAVLIEPTKYKLNASGDADSEWQAQLEQHVWEVVQATNASLDSHARVSSKKAIIVKPADKPIPRTDKGSVSRRLVHEIFATEIETAYAAMDDDLSNGNGQNQDLDLGNIEGSIRTMVKSVFARIEGQDSDQDFFERGMDSLQAVRLARLLSVALQRHFSGDSTGSKPSKVSAEFIYRNSSIASLTAAITQRITPGNHTNGSADTYDRLSEVRTLADKFVNGIRSNTEPQAANNLAEPRAVLMTGATGNLGAHMLSRLARDGSAAVKTAGLDVTPEGWQKVELVEDAAFMEASRYYTKEKHESNDGTQGVHESQSVFNRLAYVVTHIAHLAWPMDFHRTANSFIPHLQMVESLVRLSRLAHVIRGRDPARRVRLVFASSIAVVRNYEDKETVQIGNKSVPEKVTDSPAVAAPMGYAEAKWICERMLQQVALTCSKEVDPVVVRIGQLSGPETTDGVWKLGEHMPTLVKASRMVGAFPLLEGTMSWLPVDRAAKSLEEIMFSSHDLDSFLHLENPVRQPATDIMTIMAYELGIADKGLMPFEEWQQKAAELGLIESLSDFFGDHFRALALGSVILDTTKARAASGTLRGSSGVSRDLIVEYLERWKEQGLFA